MALQSQMRRGGFGVRSSHSYNRNRRSEQKRLFGYLLLTLIISAMAIYAWQSRPRSAAAGTVPEPGVVGLPRRASQVSSSQDISGQGQKAGELRGTNQTVAPLVMEMGSGRSASGAGMLLTQGRTQRADTLPAARTQLAAPEPSRAAPDRGATPEAQPSVRDPLLAPPQGHPAPPPGMSHGSSQSPDAAEATPAIMEADRLFAASKPIEARAALNRALLDRRTSEPARAMLRTRIQELNRTLLFSPGAVAGDALSEPYSVVSGDSLVKIARKQRLATEPNLIARVNRLSNPNALQIGQKLKLVRGPFHAVVHKSQFRMDVYAGPTSAGPGAASESTTLGDGVEAGWTYIASFPVGLGEGGSTPLGVFAVKENSKLVNPHWTNPRTGEKFDADDANNPIGERWIGLEGLDSRSKAYLGYGVHGTIDPSCIGREMSMGCVRMNSEDVEIVYDLLMPRVSVVKVVP